MKFQDRISEYPGRIKLTDENGEVHYYTLERADEPTQIGTPLSAENLNKLTQDVNGKTGASIVLTGDDIAISASDGTTVKERVNNVRSAASEAQNTATARETLAQKALNVGAIETIWNNNNISPISELKIPCNISSYKLILVVAIASIKDFPNDLTTGIIDPTITNKTFFISRSSYVNLYRAFNILSDGIRVYTGFKQTSLAGRDEDTNVIIPIKIIGIR